MTEIESAIALLHGDRVRVIWTDGEEDGWAYGEVCGEPKKNGYFPQQCIAAPKRPPHQLVVGQAYKVCERYEEPVGQGGHMSVAPGEVVTVLHQDNASGAWVYAEKL